MTDLAALIRDLVVANRILAPENVVDAYGHVSVRHPDKPHRFLIATSIAPELVEPGHIVEFNLDCTPVPTTAGRSITSASSMAASSRRGRTCRRWSTPIRRTCCRLRFPRCRCGR